MFCFDLRARADCFVNAVSARTINKKYRDGNHALSIELTVVNSAVKHLILDAPNPRCWMFLASSCGCLCPIDWSQVSSREWRGSWGSTNKWWFEAINCNHVTTELCTNGVETSNVENESCILLIYSSPRCHWYFEITIEWINNKLRIKFGDIRQGKNSNAS